MNTTQREDGPMADEALPGMEDDTPPADEFIQQMLKSALVANDRSKLPKLGAAAQCKTNAEIETLYAPWYRDTYWFLFSSVTAHMLIRIKDLSPNFAAGLAREVQDWLDAGDAYPEWVWDWASAAGIDPDKTIAKARAEVADWLGQPSPAERERALKARAFGLPFAEPDNDQT